MPYLIPFPPEPLNMEQAEAVLCHYHDLAGELATGVAGRGLRSFFQSGAQRDGLRE